MKKPPPSPRRCPRGEEEPQPHNDIDVVGAGAGAVVDVSSSAGKNGGENGSRQATNRLLARAGWTGSTTTGGASVSLAPTVVEKLTTQERWSDLSTLFLFGHVQKRAKKPPLWRASPGGRDHVDTASSSECNDVQSVADLFRDAVTGGAPTEVVRALFELKFPGKGPTVQERQSRDDMPMPTTPAPPFQRMRSLQQIPEGGTLEGTYALSHRSRSWHENRAASIGEERPVPEVAAEKLKHLHVVRAFVLPPSSSSVTEEASSSEKPIARSSVARLVAIAMGLSPEALSTDVERSLDGLVEILVAMKEGTLLIDRPAQADAAAAEEVKDLSDVANKQLDEHRERILPDMDRTLRRNATAELTSPSSPCDDGGFPTIILTRASSAPGKVFHCDVVRRSASPTFTVTNEKQKEEVKDLSDVAKKQQDEQRERILPAINRTLMHSATAELTSPSSPCDDGGFPTIILTRASSAPGKVFHCDVVRRSGTDTEENGDKLGSGTFVRKFEAAVKGDEDMGDMVKRRSRQQRWVDLSLLFLYGKEKVPSESQDGNAATTFTPEREIQSVADLFREAVQGDAPANVIQALFELKFPQSERHSHMTNDPHSMKKMRSFESKARLEEAYDPIRSRSYDCKASREKIEQEIAKEKLEHLHVIRSFLLSSPSSSSCGTSALAAPGRMAVARLMAIATVLSTNSREMDMDKSVNALVRILGAVQGDISSNSSSGTQTNDSCTNKLQQHEDLKAPKKEPAERALPSSTESTCDESVPILEALSIDEAIIRGSDSLIVISDPAESDTNMDRIDADDVIVLIQPSSKSDDDDLSVQERPKANDCADVSSESKSPNDESVGTETTELTTRKAKAGTVLGQRGKKMQTEVKNGTLDRFERKKPCVEVIMGEDSKESVVMLAERRRLKTAEKALKLSHISHGRAFARRKKAGKSQFWEKLKEEIWAEDDDDDDNGTSICLQCGDCTSSVIVTLSFLFRNVLMSSALLCHSVFEECGSCVKDVATATADDVSVSSTEDKASTNASLRTTVECKDQVPSEDETDNVALIYTKTAKRSTKELLNVSKFITIGTREAATRTLFDLGEQWQKSKVGKRIMPFRLGRHSIIAVGKITLATLGAAFIITDTLFEAAMAVGKKGADVAAEVVRHSFGDVAGKVVADTSESVDNSVRAIRFFTMLEPITLTKVIAKNTGRISMPGEVDKSTELEVPQSVVVIEEAFEELFSLQRKHLSPEELRKKIGRKKKNK